MTTKTIVHNYSGKSLLELREQFGIGKKGFYKNGWWINEPFAKEKLPKRTYKIELHPDWNNLNYQEQLDKMEKKEEFLHPAILVEAILTHYRKTGKRLMENWYSRTLSVDSDGHRVGVGDFGSGGLGVHYWWGDGRNGDVGVSSARKFNETGKLEVLDTFESRI